MIRMIYTDVKSMVMMMEKIGSSKLRDNAQFAIDIIMATLPTKSKMLSF